MTTIAEPHAFQEGARLALMVDQRDAFDHVVKILTGHVVTPLCSEAKPEQDGLVSVPNKIP